MQRRTLAIAATFTAEPVGEFLRFWMAELDLADQLVFAPYGQVFQALLDPESLLRKNSHGANLILLRVADLSSGNPSDPSADDQQTLFRNLRELAGAVIRCAATASVPCLVCLCPESATLAAGRRELLEQAEALLLRELASCSAVEIATPAQLFASYPLAEYEDAEAERLAHVPYTPAFFAALGTFLARRIYRIGRPTRKVLVVDCDETLWKGVCGEIGPAGVEIGDGHRALQRFLVDAHDAGTLLCVCSHNHPNDVLAVFAERGDMPLRREHVVGWRTDFRPKSEGLTELSAELGLGLDSFVLVDDNPVVCAEVRAACPEVLVLQLPRDSDGIGTFLHHVWALDRRRLTHEDRRRTDLYRENAARERAKSSAPSFADFMASLALRIEVAPPSSAKLARVAQLIERTNQFNLTTRRRTEPELRALFATGVLECAAVDVSDRFGDYGLVGLLMFAARSETLEVDTFLLSCRALGRGVEHHMLAWLGEQALEHGLPRVDLRFLESERNQPARAFLESLEATVEPTAGGVRYVVLAEAAAGIRWRHSSSRDTPSDSPPAATPAAVVSSSNGSHAESELSTRIATSLRTPDQVLSAVAARRIRVRPARAESLVPPRNATERELAELWKALLGLDEIGVEDDYFELGGTSLLGVRLFSQIAQRFDQKLPLATLLRAPTIAALAAILGGSETQSSSWSSLVAIQLEGNKRPFFCTHGAHANVLYLRELSRHLGADRPFYGLQSFGLDGEQDPHTSIEEMAAHYVREIKRVQPAGPYCLGGYSFGGIVAFEMAQQLRACGERVALLAMMDTFFPQPASHQGKRNPFRQRIYPKVATLEYHYEWAKQNGIREYLALQWRELIGRWKRPNTPHPAHWNDIPPALRRIMELNLRAQTAYVPEPYPGRITLFWASDHPPDPEDNRLSWDEVAVRGLEVHVIPGNHVSFREEPHVAVLAAKLARCLERADAVK